MSSFRVSATILLLALSLAGCGGGGGGGAPAPAPAPTPAPPAPPVNTAPVMPAAMFNGTEDQDSTGQLTATDANGDAITFTVTTPPTRGTLTTFTAAGAFVYRPNANAFGADSFVVTASDGRGGSVSAAITLNIASVDDPLAASHDRFELSYSSTLTVDVLANDANADNDAAVSIIEPALVGTATVNANNSVSITGLPANFRGLTRFRYRLTDTAGLTRDAVANVFVDTEPFRVILRTNVADPQSFDVAITDFTGEPRVLNVNQPAPANARTVSFRASENGEVVAYYRISDDPPSDDRQLCTARTAVGSVPQCYDMPGDRWVGNSRPNPGSHIYAISADGRWVAAVFERKDGTFAPSLFLIDTQTPTVATPILVTGAEHGVQPTFSSDSQYLYFTGAPTLSNDGVAIYRVRLGTAQPPQRVTRPEDPASIVDSFALSTDGTRLVLQRSGLDMGVWLVETTSAGQEYRLSHDLPGGDLLQRVQASNIAINATATSLAYVVWHPDSSRDVWMSDVSTTAPAPRLVGSVPNTSGAALNPMVRPDGNAVMYTWGSSIAANNYFVYEALKTPATPRPVMNGLWGGYGGNGEYFLGVNLVFANPPTSYVSNYHALAVAALGSPAPKAGTPGMQTVTAAADVERYAFVLGESANGSIPLWPMLVNFAAPANPLPLSSESFAGLAQEGLPYNLVAGTP